MGGHHAEEPIRVLHVDTNTGFAQNTATRLERETDQLTVRTATSATEGLEIASKSDVDCIVADYELPDKTGIELLEAIREDDPELPFILFTGTGSEAIASDAMSADATDYFRKESETDQSELLATRIMDAVTQYRAQRRSATMTQRLRELTETTDDILYMFNHDWSECLFVNSAYEDIFGRSRDRLYDHPQDFLNGIHPDDRPRVQDAMATISNGSSVELEYRVNSSDDYGRWVEVRGDPIRDDDGCIVRIAGFAREITTRKQHEQELRQTQNRMEFALDATDAIVWDWNVDTDRATFYPSEEGLYGTTVETWEEFLELVHPEDRQTVRDSVEQALETGEPKHEEVRIVDDGEVRWIEAPGEPIQDEDGTTRMIGVARDITDRKHNERELKRQNERLEEFASVVSHDLRNPLTVAEGWLDLARSEQDSEALERVARAHERMDVLIDDLLALARAGETALDVESISLRECSEAAWATVETADATLVTDADKTLAADRSRLQQLFENLYRNAVEHGGHNVTITVGELDDGFYVEDDGPGIPPDDRETVFEAGYSTSEDGTGFGLSIVNRVVETHDWKLRVTDGTAGGARFEITDIAAGE